MKGTCERIDSPQAIEDFSQYLVCAYKMDELICTEAVSCSFTIFGTDAGTTFDGTPVTPRAANRTNRLQYPKEYCRTVKITKTEIGPDTAPLRPSVTYLLERAWPFAIDAVPLQFGSTLITKVTAQFYYTRHTIIHNNINQAIKVLEESNIDDINFKSWLNEAKLLAEANSNFNKFKIKLLDLME